MNDDSKPGQTAGAPGLPAPRRSAMPEPLNMTAGQLTELIRRLPKNVLTLAIVCIEDEYETQFGDGYYCDHHRAFFSISAAELCAAWLNWRSAWKFRTHGHRAEVKLGKIVLVGAEERLSWSEGGLLELINGNQSDWVTIVETYRGAGAMGHPGPLHRQP